MTSGSDRWVPRPPSSPVCYAGLCDDVDPRQAQDVARWRSAQRDSLRAERLRSPSQSRRRNPAAALSRHLDDALAGLCLPGKVVSGYWPIKGEPDLRPWLSALDEQGVQVALPVVETRGAPLVFRRWHPGTAMERGIWNIPVPPASAEQLRPDIALAPLVGWDTQGFRLGYGGGYFDRTLAALSPRPTVVGIGLRSARLPTIFPQPYDIGMDLIISEAGLEWSRSRS